MASFIDVEVAYALPHKQKILSVTVAEGTTAKEAVELSGIVDEFPDLDIESAKMGIFGKAIRTPDSEVIRAGDRIEIYRPLLIDPKAARANRAAKVADKKVADKKVADKKLADKSSADEKKEGKNPADKG